MGAHQSFRPAARGPAGDVLGVEDDEVVQIMLAEVVRLAGGTYRAARTAEQAERLLSEQEFALVLLDRRLPDSDGLLLIDAVRRRGDCPIIVLSELGCSHDRILGLGLGATEYIAKPFNPAELSSRVRFFLNRRQANGEPAPAELIEAGRLSFAPRSRRLSIDGQTRFLPPAEARLLEVLLTQSGEVLDRDSLTQAACGRDWTPGDRTVDVLVARLRKRLPDDVARIVTVHRLGYLMERSG